MAASKRAVDTESLPVEYTADGDRMPCVTVMTGHGRNKNQPLLVFDGPEGGELVVPFNRVRYDDDRHTVVLTDVSVADRREYERKVFSAEHWDQWGDVSAWFREVGIDEIPRRLR